jgi:hypothetical protein
MSDTPNRTREINALKSILNSGARSITTDGVTTTFANEASIRKRIAELEVEQGGSSALVKPRIRSINLGSAW